MFLPKKYAWLATEPGPRILMEFIKIYGTQEAAGEQNDNPTILSWAKEIGFSSIFKKDSIPWCGLAMAFVAGRAGWEFAPRGNPLWARNWAYWGNLSSSPMLGDILVFSRGSSGHVGLYIAEDDEAYHVIGGNQSDQVSIVRIVKSRLLSARRCPWRIDQPKNIRKIKVSKLGHLSSNEV